MFAYYTTTSVAVSLIGVFEGMMDIEREAAVEAAVNIYGH
jgi:hypothetical protein